MGRAFYYGGLDSLIKLPNISEVIPSSGLFRTYVARAQRLTDSPSIYHVGALLACFAAVISKHASLLFRSGSMERAERLRLWVLLTGKSNNRKSHALDICSGCKKDVTGALYQWFKDRLCPDSGTREGFEDFMTDHPDAFMAIREAPTWLSDNRTVWMRNGAAWWCKIFDGQLERKLRGKGTSDEAPRASRMSVDIGICAAGETSAVVAASRPTDWTGGMFSRMLILGAGRKQRRDEFYEWTDADLKAITRQMRTAIRVARSAKGVVISPAAWRVFRAWNGPVDDSIEDLPAAQSAILGRLGRHIKVVASLYALSCGKTEVDADCMRAATKLGQYSHKTVMELPI